jgi:hypothetical protein
MERSAFLKEGEMSIGNSCVIAEKAQPDSKQVLVTKLYEVQAMLAPAAGDIIKEFKRDMEESFRQLDEGLVSPAESINYIVDRATQLFLTEAYQNCQVADELLARVQEL